MRGGLRLRFSRDIPLTRGTDGLPFLLAILDLARLASLEAEADRQRRTLSDLARLTLADHLPPLPEPAQTAETAETAP